MEQRLEPIFPIWVEPETDPGSQCRDYNTLRPRVCPPVERVGILLTCSPPQPRFLGSDRPKYRPARRLVEPWRWRVRVLFSRHPALRPTDGLGIWTLRVGCHGRFARPCRIRGRQAAPGTRKLNLDRPLRLLCGAHPETLWRWQREPRGCGRGSPRTSSASPPLRRVGTSRKSECRVTLAPILTSFSRSVISHECFTVRGRGPICGSAIARPC